MIDVIVSLRLMIYVVIDVLNMIVGVFVMVVVDKIV